MKKFMILAAIAATLAAVSCKKAPADQPAVTITVTPAEPVIPGEGGSINLAVETSAATISCSVKDNWLTASVNDKSITISAEANPAEAPRTTLLTVSAGQSSKEVTVTQAKGSKYPGYTQMGLSDATYMGDFLFVFTKPENKDCGPVSVSLLSEDDRYYLELVFYADKFSSEEEVKVITGEYTKGADDMANGMLVGKKMTYIPGAKKVLEDDGETEELYFGCCLHTKVGESESVSLITSGSFTISGEGQVYTIKTDLKDADGKDVKFYYEGPLVYDAEGAFLINEHGNPTDVVSATCAYQGESVRDATHLLITLTSSDGVSSNFSIYVDKVSQAALSKTDLSGTYTSEGTPGASGSADLGALMELTPGFSMPMGSYIVFGLMDYWTPDDLVSLTLVRKESGAYIITGTMRDTLGEEYNFADDRTELDLIMEEDPGDDDDDDDYGDD